ncbi:piggyBac transposable element-derived protein 3-like [Anastrepha ludens]|uniref:piggyBac transposable element-derived protein 3-like n=1 Tax=Anastrepha ludens TaxID=28586 RepID=UPI0023B19EC3|nr:piggyBac transposable element-derived protein 3-like [Anastrepha ludens]
MSSENEQRTTKEATVSPFDFMFSDSGILFVTWNDNSVVTVGTNYDRIAPLHTVKRWSRQERRKVNAQQPKLIAEYNSGMGGVDLHDQALNTYNIKFRGKKWWWPLFSTMISSCVVNAWKLYKMASKSQCDLLQYQREIVRFYLRNYNIRDISSKRSTTASIAGSSYNHFPKRISNQLRCRECHQRIRWICELCNHGYYRTPCVCDRVP